MALLILGAVAVSALTGSGIDTGTLGSGELGVGAGDDADSDAGTGYDATADETYEDDYYDTETYDSSDGIDTGSTPSVSDDTTSSSTTTSDGYVVLPYPETWANGVEDTFNAYFGGINDGDSQLGWMQLSSSRQQQTSLDEFADAVRTSHDSDFVVQEASYAGGRAHVWLEFTSTQDPELGPNPGEGCTTWSLDYALLEQPDGTFLIDEVAGHGGTTGHSAC